MDQRMQNGKIVRTRTHAQENGTKNGLLAAAAAQLDVCVERKRYRDHQYTETFFSTFKQLLM